MDAPAIVRTLGALAQEHRLAANRLLVQAGEERLPTGVIAEILGMVSSSMSFHLATLANAGLVTQRRQSRMIIYTANYPAMNELMGYLTENGCDGVPCGNEVACCTPAQAKDVA